MRYGPLNRLQLCHQTFGECHDFIRVELFGSFVWRYNIEFAKQHHVLEKNFVDAWRVWGESESPELISIFWNVLLVLLALYQKKLNWIGSTPLGTECVASLSNSTDAVVFVLGSAFELMAEMLRTCCVVFFERCMVEGGVLQRPHRVWNPGYTPMLWSPGQENRIYVRKKQV